MAVLTSSDSSMNGLLVFVPKDDVHIDILISSHLRELLSHAGELPVVDVSHDPVHTMLTIRSEGMGSTLYMYILKNEFTHFEHYTY